MKRINQRCGCAIIIAVMIAQGSFPWQTAKASDDASGGVAVAADAGQDADARLLAELTEQKQGFEASLSLLERYLSHVLRYSWYYSWFGSNVRILRIHTLQSLISSLEGAISQIEARMALIEERMLLMADTDPPPADPPPADPPPDRPPPDDPPPPDDGRRHDPDDIIILPPDPARQGQPTKPYHRARSLERYSD